MKGAFKMKLKAFLIIFKGLSMKEIIPFFVEGERLRTTASWQKKNSLLIKGKKKKEWFQLYLVDTQNLTLF